MKNNQKQISVRKWNGKQTPKEAQRQCYLDWVIQEHLEATATGSG